MRANTEKVGLINWALMILLGVSKAAVLKPACPWIMLRYLSHFLLLLKRDGIQES